MTEPTLDVTIEAILFVAGEPLSAARLSQILEAPGEDVEAALATLKTRLGEGGVRLAENHGTFRLVTAPDTAATVAKFLDDSGRQDLSRPALETLAIVAYRGPLTKSAVEQIRGVDSAAMLRNLIARGLVTEAGRSPEAGRPQLYAVSHSFLAHFGLTGAADLPPLPDPPPHPQPPEAGSEN